MQWCTRLVSNLVRDSNITSNGTNYVDRSSSMLHYYNCLIKEEILKPSRVVLPVETHI